MSIIFYIYEGLASAWDLALDIPEVLQFLLMLRRVWRHARRRISLIRNRQRPEIR